MFGSDPLNYFVITKEFVSYNDGNHTALITHNVETTNEGLKAIEGSEHSWPCDLCILSMKFVSPETYNAEQTGLDDYQCNNIHTF